MSTDSPKWRFRGEGNASLVLVNAEEKRVYRFPKYTHWGKGHFIDSEKTKAERVHEELKLVVDYMSNVMQPLLSPSFVVLPELELIPAGLTEEAETQISESRPAQRKGKDVEPITIDSSTISALVLPDLCYVRNNKSKSLARTLSIEIKPKKAFIHPRDSFSDVSEELSQVCKFCMHQRLKAKEGQWPNTSRYCPLDLFSGDRRRMKQALLALAETPQNNLRICQNGEEIHGAWNKEDLFEIFEKFFGNWPNGLTNGLRRQQALHTFLDLVLEALLFVPVSNMENEEPTVSNSNHVQYSEYTEQSVKPSVQYCQNCSVVDCSQAVTDTCHKALVDGKQSVAGASQCTALVDGKQLVSDASHNKTIVDCKQSVNDASHSRAFVDCKLPVFDAQQCKTLVDCKQPVMNYCQNGIIKRPYVESSPRLIPFCHTCTVADDLEKFSDSRLPSGCVLERVLTAQRLDSLGIHGIFPLYQQIDRHLQENPSLRNQFCLDGPYPQSGWLCLCSSEQKNCQSSIEDMYLQDSVQKIKKFLVSKTVQDCSIMVALQALIDGDKGSSPCITDPYGGRYRFSVSIIDLDPKPFCKIPTYHEQDREIVNAYKEACRRLEKLED